MYGLRTHGKEWTQEQSFNSIIQGEKPVQSPGMLQVR